MTPREPNDRSDPRDMRDSPGHDTAPATGSSEYWATELAPEEEPTVTGTLFLVMLLLMIIGAIWIIIYLRLLDR